MPVLSIASGDAVAAAMRRDAISGFLADADSTGRFFGTPDLVNGLDLLVDDNEISSTSETSFFDVQSHSASSTQSLSPSRKRTNRKPKQQQQSRDGVQEGDTKNIHDGAKPQDLEKGCKTAADDEDVEFDEDEELEQQEQDPRMPKKRGPKKKRMTPARVAKLKQRRLKANARERSRMHGLNDALEELRAHVPCFARSSQKLSKIETLRLARNYIGALAAILETGSKPDAVSFARSLVRGLSQNTANLVASCFHINPRALHLGSPHQLHHAPSSSPPSLSHFGYQLQHAAPFCPQSQQPDLLARGSFQFPAGDENMAQYGVTAGCCGTAPVSVYSPPIDEVASGCYQLVPTRRPSYTSFQAGGVCYDDRFSDVPDSVSGSASMSVNPHLLEISESSVKIGSPQSTFGDVSVCNAALPVQAAAQGSVVNGGLACRQRSASFNDSGLGELFDDIDAFDALPQRHITSGVMASVAVRQGSPRTRQSLDYELDCLQQSLF